MMCRVSVSSFDSKTTCIDRSQLKKKVKERVGADESEESKTLSKPGTAEGHRTKKSQKSQPKTGEEDSYYDEE